MNSIRHNILIISAVFPPEPVVSALLSRDLAEKLAESNSLTVICPNSTRPLGFNFVKIIEPLNYKVHHLDSFTFPASNIFGRLRESLSFGIYSVKYLKHSNKHIDCIYLNTWPLLSQYLIVKAAKKLNIPTIIHVQDIYPESLLNKLTIGKTIIKKILLPIDRLTLKNSTKIIAISEKMKQILVHTRNIPREKVEVVTNWQNEDDFIQFHNNKIKKVTDLSNPFTFMYLGNNGPLAGVEFLIYTFVKAKIHNSRLIIAGTGSRKRACIDLVNSLNINNIEFVQVPDGKVPSVQDVADVMILPVKKNGAMSSIPSKLPAYMFSAKPIIGSLDLKSDTAKAINDSGCGIVVEPENEIELIDAMKEVSEWSNQTIFEKGNLGFNYAILNFSKRTNLDKIVSIIESVI